ncbi:TPA: alpha/beta hydrolase, partial [Serratia marcescens]
MPLDERIAAFLTASADAPPPASLAEMRAATETGLRRLQGEAEPSGGVRDYTVIAADGYRIALRAYLPARENCAAAQPAMLFAHGGGWCLGSLALYDRPCQALANATGRVILSVDYRLAPEYPFPQPLEDVYQALCWVAQQAPQLGIDAQRLAV